jgi:hypothetical protein
MSLFDVLDQFSGSSVGGGSKTQPLYQELRIDAFQGAASGGDEEAASSSRERGFPERIDINEFMPQGFGGNPTEEPPAAMQVLEAAGRAPGFVMERPLALVDQLLSDEDGNSPLDSIGEFGPIAFLGDVVHNVSSLPAALGNSSVAESLAQGTKERWADDMPIESTLDRLIRETPLGLLLSKQKDGGPKTWGEFKADAARKGWTEQDVLDVIEGRKGKFDFGDKAMSADPMSELVLRLASDPFNLIFGVGAAAKIGSGVGLLGRAVRAGAVAEKPLAPSLAAAAARAGIAADSTWMGLARYFGEFGQGVAAIPGGAAAVGVAARGAELGATAAGLYKKSAIGLSAGQAGLAGIDRATGGGGFLEPLIQLNRDVWDNQPLSQNSAFSLWSAFHFDPIRGAGRIIRTTKAAKYAAFGSDVRGRVLGALAEGESWAGKASQSEILARLGGREALDNLIVHTHAQMVFERLMKNPVVKATLTHFDSLDEAILANRKLGEMIETILVDEYKNARIGGKQTVDQLKKWHAQRSGITQAIEFPWDGMNAVDRWVEYSSAVAPVSQIFHERGDIVMGLIEHVMAEDLRNMRAALGIVAGESKMVPVTEVRKWLSRFPQLATDEWWAKFNLAEFNGQSVEVGKLYGKLKKLEKTSPTARDITREMSVAERAAARPEISQLETLDPLDRVAPRGEATVNVSRMRPTIARRLGLNASRVDDVQASRVDPDVATFEGRVGETLTKVGFEVDEVSQAIGAYEGALEPSVEIVMSGSTIPEMRLAAALLGKAGSQDSVAWSVTGRRLRELGVNANGYEVKFALPNANRAQLQSVVEILGREFDGFTVNDTLGTVRILAQGGNEGDLAAKLARVGPDIEALYPRDLLGDSGMATSVHPAYVEFLTKQKEDWANGTYADAIRDSRRDPRAGSSNAVRSALSRRRAAPANAQAGLGPDAPVGRQPGDAGRPASDLSLAPADRVGLGLVDNAQVEPGFLYHITDADSLAAVSGEGLRPFGAEGKLGNGPLKWYDGGTGKRIYWGNDPQWAAMMKGADGPVLRVRESDAGRVRRDLETGESYSARRVPASLIEVYGADGQWHRLDEWFAPALETDIAQAAQQTLPEFQAAAADGPFDPTPDPLTAGLRAIEDQPWSQPGVPGDEAVLAQELAGLTRETVLDEATAARAQDVQRQLEGARLAKGEAKRGEVLWSARRDAEISSQIPFHRSLARTNTADLEQFERFLREHYPTYTLQKAPVPAIIMADRGDIAARYLKDRTALGNALADWGPFGRVNRLIEWLASPVKNENLGRAARQALMNELIPKGAKPSEVDAFLMKLEQQASIQTIGPFQVRAFRNGTSLTQQAINKIAAGDPEVGLGGIFSQKTIEAIGRNNFARVLDRASNRFIRQMEATASRGGQRGRLARGVANFYGAYQKTAVGDTTRLVSKTMYHWFRFVSDPRWWAMNILEADTLGGLKYGIGATRFRGAHKVEPGSAALMHQFGPQGADSAAFERALGDGNGWLYTRRLGGYVSRGFDHERPDTVMKILKGMEANDPVIADLREIVRLEDLKSGRMVRTAEEVTDQDLVQAIDRMLYSYDVKGAKATVVEEAEKILGHEETMRVLPFLQKVWEANDKTFRSVSEIFHGNASRTNLERIANSYWLYWPISYQIKATKWLVDVMTHGAFGKQTNLAGAALYAHHAREHKKRLATNPEYVALFEDHPTAWFLVQMMFPITPGDIGVSLSRPVRYTGGALGVWGEYKNADDPVTAAGAVMSLGPVYTAELLARLGRELFAEPTENLYP